MWFPCGTAVVARCGCSLGGAILDIFNAGSVISIFDVTLQIVHCDDCEVRPFHDNPPHGQYAVGKYANFRIQVRTAAGIDERCVGVFVDSVVAKGVID